MNELDPKDVKKALSELNFIAPDTVDEGEFGPWKFTKLTKSGNTYTLSFTNSEGKDKFVFDFEEPLIVDGGVNQNWVQLIMDISIEEGW